MDKLIDNGTTTDQCLTISKSSKKPNRTLMVVFECDHCNNPEHVHTD